MDPVQLAHLLRRTEFVARPSRMTELSAATRSDAIDNILNVTTPVAIPAYIDHDIDNEGYNQWVFAVQWWLDRMVDSPKPMQERMAFFWHGHFCSSWDKVNSAGAMMEQNRLFRDSAFGNFRTMTQTMSIQPAMLFYLDNLDNVKSSPNQNFARELLELFTLGVVDQNGQPNYTENDVTAAARAWTGHGIDWNTYLYKFWPGDHDGLNKTFMGQTRNWNGPDIINYVLQENTAKKLVACKFLTKKLWEHFAYQNPAQAIVDAVAQVLYDNDFAIKPWVKAMLMRDEFYGTAATQGLVRSPVEYIVNLFYFTGYRGTDMNPQWYMEEMGQEPFAPPNVAGWKTNAYWVNTSLFGSRADFAESIASHMRQGNANNVGKKPDNTKRTPAETVDFAASLFGIAPGTLSATSYNALLSYVTAQRAAEPYVGWWEATNLLTMIPMTPEFHTA
ncbi:MAG: DUF1800 domain-containing protein [Ilumatobacteraceae bacterium]